MYDYAGEWTYRVGFPAKSGVGGGIAAALPSQMGVGTFSPLLDKYGNSARGLRFCETLSSRFDLHILNRSADVRTCIIADYDIASTSSRRSRQPHEQELLTSHHDDVRVIEFVGALNFANMDYAARRLASEGGAPRFCVLDFRRVPDITVAGARLLSENLATLAGLGVTPILTGFEKTSMFWQVMRPFVSEVPKLHRFEMLDEAIEWAEDQVIYRYGGFIKPKEPVKLGEQALLAGLSDLEIARADAAFDRAAIPHRTAHHQGR